MILFTLMKKIMVDSWPKKNEILLVLFNIYYCMFVIDDVKSVHEA